MNREDALADQIVDFVKRGKIPPEFRVQDVRRHFNRYAESHVRTVLANYAVGGYWEQQGHQARFKRVARGLYELVSNRESSSAADPTEQPVTPRIITADDLGAMRRHLIQLLNHIEGKPASHEEGVSKRVVRLRKDGNVPPRIANWMLTIQGIRNVSEYEGGSLTQNESNAIKAAWAEVHRWGELQNWRPSKSTSSAG